jgi:hypothetical protein
MMNCIFWDFNVILIDTKRNYIYHINFKIRIAMNEVKSKMQVILDLAKRQNSELSPENLNFAINLAESVNKTIKFIWDIYNNLNGGAPNEIQKYIQAKLNDVSDDMGKLNGIVTKLRNNKNKIPHLELVYVLFEKYYNDVNILMTLN